MKNMPSNLCGVLSGCHVYISVKDVTSVKLTVKLTSLSTQKWSILVRQYDSSQTEYLAPRGCLQYYRQDMGTLETFNYNGGSGACSEAVVFGTNQLCGSTFGTSGQLNWNY